MPKKAKKDVLEKDRRCRVCGCKLRSGNSSTICSPCDDKLFKKTLKR